MSPNNAKKYGIAAVLLVPILTLCGLAGIFSVAETENITPEANRELRPIGPRAVIRNESAPGAAVVTAEIADSAEERATGLMGRESLGENEGMLFIFPETQQVSFWMKNTLIPLDIIFIKEDFTIDSIAKNTKPLQTDELYDSQGEVKYVLEVNAGFSDENSYSIGDKLEINFTPSAGAD